MTTVELIEALQHMDPDGTCDVVVGNEPIYHVNRIPAYWDGPMQRLIRSPDSHYYNVIGLEFVASGEKVTIETLPFEDVLLNDPETPVAFVGGGDDRYWGHTKERVHKALEDLRQAKATVKAQLERRSDEPTDRRTGQAVPARESA